MTNEIITFGQLRRLLLDLGFVEKKLPEGHIVFGHKASDCLLPFPAYKPKEPLKWHHLALARAQLDYRGLLSREAFERRLHEPAA